MWMTMGQFRKVIDKTGHIVTGQWKIDAQGYAHVLILKAYAYHGPQTPFQVVQNLIPYKGMAWEGQEKFDTALETYAKASDYIHAAQPPSNYYAVQHWISKIMYRLCLLSLRLEEPLAALTHFRQYKMLVDTTFKENMGARERVAIYYWYWRTLSDIVRERMEKEKDIPPEYVLRKIALIVGMSHRESIFTS